MGFTDIGLSYQFVVALGGLIVVVFAAALGRLYWTRRKLARDQKTRDVEVAEKATRKAVTQEKTPEEGDYFGVRAIERGYFGGVAQSEPSTANNSPQLSPVRDVQVREVLHGNASPVSFAGSRRSSISEISLSSHERASRPASIRSQASGRSLRLQPSDAELNGRRNHDPAGTISTFGQASPSLPTSTSQAKAPDGLEPNSDNVSKASVPPNTPPIPNPQVQSYAQWRLSAHTKGSKRARRKMSSAKLIDAHVEKPYTNPKTGRRKSRTASTVELSNQIESLQRALDARRAAGSSHIGNMSIDTIQEAVRRASLLQNVERGRKMSFGNSARQTSGGLRRNSKFSTRAAPRRKSRALSRTYFDLNTNHKDHDREAAGCNVELVKPSSSATQDHMEQSSSRSLSPSTPLPQSQSPSSGSVTFAPSINWKAKPSEDAPRSPDGKCDLCKKVSGKNWTESAAVKPVVSSASPIDPPAARQLRTSLPPISLQTFDPIDLSESSTSRPPSPIALPALPISRPVLYPLETSLPPFDFQTFDQLDMPSFDSMGLEAEPLQEVDGY